MLHTDQTAQRKTTFDHLLNAYVCVCTYINIHVCICIYIYIYIYMYTHIYIYIYIHMYVCQTLKKMGMTRIGNGKKLSNHFPKNHRYAYTYTYMYLCLCIYIYIYVETYTYIYMYIQIYKYIYKWRFRSAWKLFTWLNVRMKAYTCTYVSMHVGMCLNI